MKLRSLFKIIYLLVEGKIKFKTPKNFDLVIYDIKSINDINFFFKQYNYFVIETRLDIIKKLYISPKIIFYLFKNYTGSLSNAYILSLLEIIKPKVVLTRVDNSIKFSEIAKICEKKYVSIAIQSAARVDYTWNNLFYKTKKININFNEKIYLPHFFCFGEYEIKQFKDLNVKVQNFYPTGDLQFSEYLEYKKKNIHNIIKKKDICFITDYIVDRYHHAYMGSNKKVIEEFNSHTNETNINKKKGILKLLKYVIYFAQQNKISLAIPLKRDKRTHPKLAFDEKNFFEINLNKKELEYFNKCVVEKDRQNYSSLEALMNSNLAIGWTSTLLRNKIGAGGKVLACNFIDEKLHNFPINGICSLRDCNYEEFEKRVNNLLSMSEKDFQLKIEKKPSYVMKFDQDMPTSEILKRKLYDFGVLTDLKK